MLNPMDLSGHTILVTGASSGIGRETAVVLSQLGARLVLVARNMKRLKETAERLDGSGHRIESFDLKAVDDIPQWLKSITAEVGLLHGLVHSAGVQITCPLRFTGSERVEELMQTNVGAAIGLAKAFRQKGVYCPGSSIVFLSSIAGLVGRSAVAVYAASKGAIIALTKSLAMEYVRDGIRVNCIAPGFVKTEMTKKVQEGVTPEQFTTLESLHPLGMGRPIDIAYAVAFLLADTGRWITGTTLVVDGGYTAQ